MSAKSFWFNTYTGWTIIIGGPAIVGGMFGVLIMAMSMYQP